jgi:hypothetical protein
MESDYRLIFRQAKQEKQAEMEFRQVGVGGINALWG